MAGTLLQRTRRATWLVLVLLGFGLVCGAVLVLAKGRPQPLLQQESALQPQALTLLQGAAAPGGPLVERPLFWVTRSPYEPEDELLEEIAPAQGPGALDDVKLLGIVVGSIGQVSVIVEAGKERRRLEVGDEIGNWMLSGLTQDTAVFIGPGPDGLAAEQTLTLEHARVSPNASLGGRVRVIPDTAPQTDAADTDEVPDQAPQPPDQETTA